MPGSALPLLLCALSAAAPAQALRRQGPDTAVAAHIMPQTSLSGATTVSGKSFGVLFAADMVADRQEVSLSFALPTKRVDLLADCANKSVAVDSHGEGLDADDLLRLGQLAESLRTEEPPQEVCTAGRLLLHAAILLARAPLGVPLLLEPGRTTSHVVCLLRGSEATATWTDSRGRGRMELTVGESRGLEYGCMGRCGAGCHRDGPMDRWTQDCLNHDTCSYMNGSTMGPFDSNCGDEFLAACDDYLFDRCDKRQGQERDGVGFWEDPGSPPSATDLDLASGST
uniref:DUF8213 domain-containing protein n=1 Tax=Alexandrium monilatum TaxID=311494 RepID=A0A7S4VHX5_9DINO|mmetsp:Transcript_3708/g.11961  ORF Transcript_3708/g.11961 Transcript_3708/m.11961 type:complete len:284 (+) Transcript_3708:86-937(+)